MKSTAPSGPRCAEQPAADCDLLQQTWRVMHANATLPHPPAGPAHDADPARPIDFFKVFFAIAFSNAFCCILPPIWDPQIAKNRTRGRKSAFGDGVGCDFRWFLVPLPFGVAVRTDFNSIFHRNSYLNRKSFFTQAPDFFRRGDLKHSM